MRLRLFLTCWLVFALHFATNIVREHYPAFTLAEHGTLRVDEYAGFHSDIFRHADGHWYINNNVGASVVAALPLWLLAPLLDRLETRGKAQSRVAPQASRYDTEYPNRARFLALVRARGLELRFGAAAAITATLLMAPITAALVVLFFGQLRARGIATSRAVGASLLLAFATPVFFRTAHLNHNHLVMCAAFGAFACLWPRPGAEREPTPAARLFAAGLLAGAAVAFDFSGVASAVALGGYVLWRHGSLGGPPAALRAATRFALGLLPPAAFVLGSQWVQFGNPFLPPASWMATAHFTDRGWRGFSWPDPELFAKNLLDPSFGLLAFAPILILGLWPSARQMASAERGFVVAHTVLVMLFCCCNQYGRMQWNTGSRYLLVLVPFFMLAVADRLARWPAWVAWLIGVPAVIHAWVLAMARATPPDFPAEFADSTVARSWASVLANGPQLPWLTVLRQTSARDAWVQGPWVVGAVLLVAAFALALVWWPAWRRMVVAARGAA